MVRLVPCWQRLLSAPFSAPNINRSQVISLRYLHRMSTSNAAILANAGAVLSKQQRYSSDAFDSGHGSPDFTVKRGWCEEAEAKPDDFVLRVGSFNLLAQHQIEKNLRLYKHCQPDDIDWMKRRDRLVREIAELSCDILCLQEVQVDHFDEFLRPFLEANDYECHFKNKTRACFDGCAIVFKRSKFVLDHVELVEYFRPHNRVLRADNVGIVVRLIPRAAPALGPFCVANTHLYFNPERGDIKLAQVSLLLATIDAMARRRGADDHLPIILCGDLNSEPTSSLVTFLVSGSLENYTALRRCDISDQNPTSFSRSPTEVRLVPEDLPPPGVTCECRFIIDRDQKERPDQEDHLRHHPPSERDHLRRHPNEGDHLRHYLKLTRVLTDPEVTCPTRAERLVTSYTAHGACSVDHILYTAANLRVLGYRHIVPPEEFVRVGGIPNSYHGSDHIPMLAEFALFAGEADKNDYED